MVLKLYILKETQNKMELITLNRSVPVNGHYDIIVAGGGVAGVAAAVSAARLGKSVMLIEKSVSLGGLATIGLVNLFVPMCNGRGTQIIKGMAEELFRLSIKYGFDTVPECWKNGEPISGGPRYLTRFSAPVFVLALSEYVKNEGVKVMYDSLVSHTVMRDKHCYGVVVENKSGSSFYSADIFIDTTGDGDVMRLSGVPTTIGQNYHTMYAYGADLESCRSAADSGNIAKMYKAVSGGTADLYGNNHPKEMPLWKGADAESVTNYILSNHIDMLNNIKGDDRVKRDVFCLPTMPQLRTTCHLNGDAVFSADNAYKHFDDSIAAICDFDRRDYLYEVPYGVLVKTGYDNIITAGRTASAEGYGWDVLRVIPPAIITGQAAGCAAVQAISDGDPIYDIDIKKLQNTLESQDVMIHFDDSLIPDESVTDAGSHYDSGEM